MGEDDGDAMRCALRRCPDLPERSSEPQAILNRFHGEASAHVSLISTSRCTTRRISAAFHGRSQHLDPPFDDDVQAIDRGFLQVNICEEPYAAYRIEYDLSELKVPWPLQPDRLALGGPRGHQGPSSQAAMAKELKSSG